MSEAQNSPRGSQESANQLFDLADAEQQKRNAERGPALAALTRQRAGRVSLAVAVPILIALLVVSFARPYLASLLETSPPASVAHEEAQRTLDALVSEIEAFRKDYHELPETLVEIGVPPRGQWKYAVFGSEQYRVQGWLYGQSVSFSSTGKSGDR